MTDQPDDPKFEAWWQEEHVQDSIKLLQAVYPGDKDLLDLIKEMARGGYTRGKRDGVFEAIAKVEAQWPSTPS